jgi:hypothetical protein
VLLLGVCLWVVRKYFGNQVPTLEAFARDNQVSTDTLRRTVRSLLLPVARLLRQRRPGRRRKPLRDAAPGALRAINALLHALLPGPIVELLSDEQARCRVLDQVRHWREKGVKLGFLATFLGIEVRTLSRWAERRKSAGVTRRSRRPHHSPGLLPEEVRIALRKLRRALPGLSMRELTRVLHERCRRLLDKYGIRKVSRKTVSRHVRGVAPKTARREKPERSGSARGSYAYPPPFAMAWIDTTMFAIAGVRVHIVVAMESFSRLVLEGEVFVQETSAAAASVIERALARVPGLGAVVRDRGKPYLNENVDALLARHHCVPINAYRYFPIDKAALERFFGTLKTWLRQALASFEEQCRASGRTPTRDEIVEILGPALRVFLRAYNLLPQPYLEDKCPIERLEAALAKAGVPSLDRDALCKLAQERTDRDEFLGQLRDALGLSLDLVTLRRSFASVSTKALRLTLDTCLETVLAKGEKIRDPLRYLIAIAKTKSRGLVEDEVAAKASHQRAQKLISECRQLDAARARENAVREQVPEQFLESDLKAWIQLDYRLTMVPLLIGQGTLAANLATTMADAARKLGSAFEAEFQSLLRRLPELVASLRPHAMAVLDKILATLHRLRADPPAAQPPPPPRSRVALSFVHVNNPVRPAPFAPVPHVGGTDVRS